MTARHISVGRTDPKVAGKIYAEGKQLKLRPKVNARTGYRITARAPTRIDLAGGTLDIWPLYLFHPGALTVNCAITRYATCIIETAPRNSRRITLISVDTSRRESFASLAELARTRRFRWPLLAELVKFF